MLWNLLLARTTVRSFVELECFKCTYCRERVRQIRNTIRPPRAFVVARARRRAMFVCPGASYKLSIDGHDKLSFAKLFIYGGIDVYSRKILFLKVCRNNRDRDVVANMYLDSIRQNGGEYP